MDEKMISEKKIWGSHDLIENTVTETRFGNVRLWFKLNSDELWIAHEKVAVDEANAETTAVSSDDLKWGRWAFKKAPALLRIAPVFPDRSVVAKPEHPFSIAVRAQAMIYVRVPAWLRIETDKKTNEPLLEVPSVVLSNTWFGTFTDGELCYWLSTKARREIAPDPENPHLIVCPVRITNTSEDELLVEKLRLQVKGLSVYDNDGQLWADETRITFKGRNDVSRIEIINKKPEGARNAELLMAPREPMKKGLAARTFTSISSLPGFELFR